MLTDKKERTLDQKERDGIAAINALRVMRFRIKQGQAVRRAEGSVDEFEGRLHRNKATEYGARADLLEREVARTLAEKLPEKKARRVWKSLLTLLKWMAFAFLFGASVVAGQRTVEHAWPQPHGQIDINYPEVE